MIFPMAGFSLIISSFVKNVCCDNLLFWLSTSCCFAVASSWVLNGPPTAVLFPVSSILLSANLSPCCSTLNVAGLTSSSLARLTDCAFCSSGSTVASGFCCIPSCTFGSSIFCSCGLGCVALTASPAPVVTPPSKPPTNPPA